MLVQELPGRYCHANVHPLSLESLDLGMMHV